MVTGIDLCQSWINLKSIELLNCDARIIISQELYLFFLNILLFWWKLSSNIWRKLKASDCFRRHHKKTSQEKITCFFRQMGTSYTIGYVSIKITRKNHKITDFILSNGKALRAFPYKKFFWFRVVKKWLHISENKALSHMFPYKNTFFKNLSSESDHSQNSTFYTFCLFFSEHRRKA